MSQSFPSEDVELGGPVLFVETVWRGAFDKGAIKETSQTMYMYIMDEIKQPPLQKRKAITMQCMTVFSIRQDVKVTNSMERRRLYLFRESKEYWFGFTPL